MRLSLRLSLLFLPILLVTSVSIAKTSSSDILVSDVRKIPRYGQYWVTGKLKNSGDTPVIVKLKLVARDKYDVAVEAREFWPNAREIIPAGEIVTFGHYVQKDASIVRVDVKVKEIVNKKPKKSGSQKKRFWFF